MKDLRQILLTALIPAINTATGKKCYTRIPKQTGVTYPYLYISEIYQTENGHKTKYQYEIDLLVQIIYQDIDSLTALNTDMDNVLSIVKNGVSPFALTGGYKVTSCELISSNTTEFQTETGTQNVGLVRMLYNIE